MKRMLQLTGKLAVLPHHINAVQASDLDDATCTVYLTGQSALDGFHVELEAEQVVADMNAALKQEAIDKAALDLGKHVLGEPATGYEPPRGLGPFRCGNCQYYKSENSSCGQETMLLLSRQPRTSDGRVRVAQLGCCEFVSRKPRVDEEYED